MKTVPDKLSSRPFWLSKTFLLVLVIKISCSFFFASFYMRDLFTPFINWFVLSGFRNPWEFFYSQDRILMFPYPTTMLLVMTLPRLLASFVLSGSWETVTGLHLLVMRIPLLVFDIFLLYQFLLFFPTQQKKVLWIYWCSPIVFFINYIHGQLDIIPTALFFSSVYLLIRERHRWAFFLFAVAVAAKSHLFVALPFLCVFLYKKKLTPHHYLWNLLVFSGTYLLLLMPYLGSEGFREMVFQSTEQKKLFDFTIPISNSLNLLICPTIITLLFLKFASYKKLNQEIFMMFLGLNFTALVIFVPAMPGWFLWPLPFLIYFYLGNKDYSRAPFILFNMIYVIHFLFFFPGEGPLFLKKISTAIPFKDLSSSVVIASAGFIALWMYNLGARRNEELRTASRPLLIGIGGDSGSGKRFLTRVLRSLFGKSRSISICGDDFHKWERGDEHWQVYTHLNPAANRLHQNLDIAVSLKNGRDIEIGHYSHETGKFTPPKTIFPHKFVFFVGLHPFYLKKMRDSMQIKIFMETDETLRRYWKMQRDILKRGYQKDQILDQIQVREQDKQKFIEPQKNFADLIVRYEATKPLDIDHPSGEKPELSATYALDNSVHLEPLVTYLSLIETLKIKITNSIYVQELNVRGSVSAKTITDAAYSLGLNLDELLVRRAGWLKNINGISQLVFLLVYNHKMKV